MMHPKGDNNWMFENIDYGSSAALPKNNFRQPIRYNDYMMQNQNQSNLKNEQYSNYYNHLMSAQNNTAYSNNYSNYSNYSYVNNQQGMQTSQSVWGIRQTPYCLGPSCANHSNIPNAAPAKPIQYSHSSYERSSVSHNMGRLENPVMDSLSHVPNYAPHYNHQSNYENPHLTNSKIIQNNKRFVSETSKIQVRNVFELNNTVCNQTDTNIAQRSNKPGQMNCFLNCVLGQNQNQNQIIPSIKQHENVYSSHGNLNPMKSDQHEGMKSVTKMCQNIPNINPVNINRNNGYCCQNNASNNLNLTQQFNQNSNMVEKIARERNTFPEKIDAEDAYRKKHASCMQEGIDSERPKKAMTFAIEQVKTQENIKTGIPKKSPSAQKSTKDLTNGESEESVFFTKKSGSKFKTMKKAILARKVLVQELQDGSNCQGVDEVEEDTPEVITIKEEKEDWPSENSYTVETCVIENESINKNKDEDLYVIKSKFENKINKDKLNSLMGFLSHESLGNKRNIIQNATAEKDCSPTLESIQFENNNNNKRKLDGSGLNQDRKKLTKIPSSELINLALMKAIDVDDIDYLKNIVLRECGLEPEEADSRVQSSTFEETELLLKDADGCEKESPTNIERDNTDHNSKVVEKESSSSPKEVIVKEVTEKSTKKRRSSKRNSTDNVKEKSRLSIESLNKSKTKDVGVQKVSEPEMCPACLSKSNENEPEEIGGTIKTMKAFQSLKYHKCMSCDLTSPSNTFWINVVTAELRCLNCFKKMVKKTEELLK